MGSPWKIIQNADPDSDVDPCHSLLGSEPSFGCGTSPRTSSVRVQQSKKGHPWLCSSSPCLPPTPQGPSRSRLHFCQNRPQGQLQMGSSSPCWGPIWPPITIFHCKYLIVAQNMYNHCPHYKNIYSSPRK